jgi:hypothetical protein
VEFEMADLVIRYEVCRLLLFVFHSVSPIHWTMISRILAVMSMTSQKPEVFSESFLV